MEEIRRSPPNMYETLQRMGYLPYELVNAGFLNQQQYHLLPLNLQGSAIPIEKPA